MRYPEDPEKDRGNQYYPSPERMQKIEEVFRKMGLMGEKSRFLTSDTFPCSFDEPLEMTIVTHLSNSSEPYTDESDT